MASATPATSATFGNPLLTMIREVCALGRAELDRPHTPGGDTDAARLLVRGLHANDPDGQPSDISLSLELLAPRAPYFDRLVLDAMATGTRQIVNLGAGYDDRALRFQSPGVRFYDLDLPHIIADKARRLATLTNRVTLSTLVPTNLETDDLDEVLRHAGHDADQPTLFLAEHLLLFLAPPRVEQLITTTRRRAAAGSTLAITAEAHPVDLDPLLVIARVDRQMFGGAGPVRTIQSRPAWLAMLVRAGWLLDDADQTITVDHFQLPIGKRDVQIHTHFLTATV